jgi:hypothetical protein
MRWTAIIGPFTQMSDGQQSGWSLRIVPLVDGKVEFNLHWGDKEEPTHFAVDTLENLKRLLP